MRIQNKMALWIVVISILLSFGVGFAFERFYQSSDAAPVENFSFTDIQGQERNLTDFKGKTVLIHFWATWCPPCLLEFPSLNEQAQKRPDDIVIIAFSADVRSADIDAFVSKQFPEGLSPNFILVHDESQTVMQGRFNVFGLPETLILNKDFEIMKRVRGAIDWTSPIGQKYLAP